MWVKARIKPRLRLATYVAPLALVGFAAGCGGDSSSKAPTATTQGSNASIVSAPGLRTLASVLGRPIYWAGSERDVLYELTQPRSGRIVVRYLPRGQRAGVAKPFLSIGTYPVRNAFAVTQAAASRAGAVRLRIGGRGVALYYRKSPTSVYFAYPGSGYQIEVFDPNPRRSRQLVLSGRVVPVSGSSSVSVTKHALSARDLRRRVAPLGRPVYWAGPEQGVTYELTQTPFGRVFVRYLPRGVKAGARRQFLTVGTYEVQNAYAVTLAAAGSQGSTRVPTPGGVVAFFRTAHPKSVYVAFRRLSYQVEVFDPSPGRARRLVASGKLGAVG